MSAARDWAAYFAGGKARVSEVINALRDVEVLIKARADLARGRIDNVVGEVGRKLSDHGDKIDKLCDAVSELDSRVAKIESAQSRPSGGKVDISHPLTPTLEEAQRIAKREFMKGRKVRPADANGEPIEVGDLVCEVGTDRCYRVTETDGGFVTGLTALSDLRGGGIYRRDFIEARSFVVVEKAPS